MRINKLSGIITLSFLAVLITQCNTEMVKKAASNPIHTMPSVNIIPFEESPNKWGYVDWHTGEIIIKAKYLYTYPFIGDFALVRLDIDRVAIIDRNEKRLSLGRFTNAYFFASEDEKTVIAMLERERKRTKFSIGLYSSPHFYNDSEYDYWMVNLSTGETITGKKDDLSIISGIETIGQYFRVEDSLYRYLETGSVECVSTTIDKTLEILTQYFEELDIPVRFRSRNYGMNKEGLIDYKPYIDARYADPDFTGAFKDIHPDIRLRFEEAEPFFRDPREYTNTPVMLNSNRMYQMKFVSRVSRREIQYVYGLYNETQEKWEVMPYFINDDTKELFFVYEITQRNNPNVYLIRVGKIEQNSEGNVYEGSFRSRIYNSEKNEFIPNAGYHSGSYRFLFPDKGRWFSL